MRVLVADASSVIKRSIEIALQDVQAQVQAVTSGDEVLMAAEQFNPQIIFVDALLPRKSGYSVLAEIKQHGILRNTPVVFLWSGFIDVDEDKLKAHPPSARLEKPFEAKTVRDLVSSLLDNFQKSPVFDFLDFPSLPKDPLDQEEDTKSLGEEFAKVPLQQIKPQGEGLQKSKMTTTPTADFDPDADFDFSSMELESFSSSSTPSKAGGQSHQDPSGFDQLENELTSSMDQRKPSEPENEDFQVDLSDEEINLIDEESMVISVPRGEGTFTAAAQSAMVAEQNTTSRPNQKPLDSEDTKLLIEQSVEKHLLKSLTLPEIEKHVQQQARDIIKEVAWKVIPEVATRIIREELKRLLDEESSKLGGPGL